MDISMLLDTLGTIFIEFMAVIALLVQASMLVTWYFESQ
jgi:hypothetical protein